MITIYCVLLAFCAGWSVRSRQRRATHRPRALALLGERHTVGALPPAKPSGPQWRCVETGQHTVGICGCIGCRDRIRNCFPRCRTWQDVEAAWHRGELAVAQIRRGLMATRPFVASWEAENVRHLELKVR